MSEAKALLVDLDGTLVDTGTANFLAYAEALAEVGVEVERARFDPIAAGRNWRQFLPELLENVPGADPKKVAARKAEIYPTKLDHTVLNHALVALIASRGPASMTALVTTASAGNAAAVLDHHHIAGLFDTIVTGSDVARHKPFPDAHRLAARRLGVVPEACIAFEDSDVGVAAARAFGSDCIRILFEPHRPSRKPVRCRVAARAAAKEGVAPCRPAATVASLP